MSEVPYHVRHGPTAPLHRTIATHAPFGSMSQPCLAGWMTVANSCQPSSKIFRSTQRMRMRVSLFSLLRTGVEGNGS